MNSPSPAASRQDRETDTPSRARSSSPPPFSMFSNPFDFSTSYARPALRPEWQYSTMWRSRYDSSSPARAAILIVRDVQRTTDVRSGELLRRPNVDVENLRAQRGRRAGFRLPGRLHRRRRRR